MAYTRNPTWVDQPSTATPATSAAVNHIEDGLVAAAAVADAATVTAAGALQVANNLSEITDVLTAQENLGIGTAANADIGLAPGNVVTVGSDGKLPAAVLRSSGSAELQRRPTAVAESMPRRDATAVTTLTSGQPLYASMTVQANVPIKSLVFMSNATAAASPTHQWAVIRDMTTKVVIAVSTDLTTTAWAAGAEQEFVLTSPWTPTADTLVAVGVCVVASTVPSLVGDVLYTPTASLDPLMAFRGATGQSTPPTVGSANQGGVASAETYTGSSNMPWCWATQYVPAASSNPSGQSPRSVGTVDTSQGTGQFTVAFVDDFTGSGVGSAGMDTANWSLYNGPGSSSTYQHKWSPSCLSVGSSVVNMYQKKTGSSSTFPTADSSYPWRFGGFASYANLAHSTHYGRWRWRARWFNNGRGVWRAHGLFHDGTTTYYELDATELFGQFPNLDTNYTTWHYPTAQQSQTIQNGLDLSQWHTFGIDWGPSGMYFTFDGVIKKSITDSTKLPSGTSPLYFFIQTVAPKDGVQLGLSSSSPNYPNNTYNSAPDSGTATDAIECSVDWVEYSSYTGP